MFDVSWGEIAVLGAVGIAVTGKRDLPTACRFVGHQLGRVVGLLQGARARADRFAHHNELRALQNELRSGLRELDHVKTELAVAASSRGVVGRSLGSSTLSANNKRTALSATTATATKLPFPSVGTAPILGNPATNVGFPIHSTKYEHNNTTHTSWNNNNNNNNTRLSATTHKSELQPLADMHSSRASTSSQLNLSDFDFTVTDTDTETEANNNIINNTTQPPPYSDPLPSAATQSERAVMEDEWNKQGIGFRARAERGSWKADDNDGAGSFAGGFGGGSLDGGGGGGDSSSSSIVDTTRATGSELLEDLERQCLVFDQYDRVVGEQEAEMHRRVERIREERLQGTNVDGEGATNTTTKKQT